MLQFLISLGDSATIPATRQGFRCFAGDLGITEDTLEGVSHRVEVSQAIGIEFLTLCDYNQFSASPAANVMASFCDLAGFRLYFTRFPFLLKGALETCELLTSQKVNEVVLHQ